MPQLSRRILAALLSVGACLSMPVMAEQRPVVVELYTSQGCSSCPPADALLGALNERDDVIAIALHVDHWDYIGWEDEFGQPAHAERQRAYAAEAGRRTVFTPEMVVNGQSNIVGAKPMVLSKAIADHKAKPARMTLSATREGDVLKVEGAMIASGAAPMDIHILRLTPEHVSKITRGENRGKTYTYTNIAHSWSVAGTWDGQEALVLSLGVVGDDPVVVLVQETGAGPIGAAARVD